MRVSFDETELVLSAQARAIARIAWADVARVVIRTTDDGPYFPDVYWEIYGDGEEPALMLPHLVAGTDELVRELQRRLPGFANDRFIQAMSSTSNEVFVLWTSG